MTVELSSPFDELVAHNAARVQREHDERMMWRGFWAGLWMLALAIIAADLIYAFATSARWMS